MTKIKIISGGQNGVDRAALDVAERKRLSRGGWCVRYRRAEDGPIPSMHPLRETASEDPRVRTELNVVDSDGTLILSCGEPRDGTPFTKDRALHHKKPCLEVDLDRPIDPECVRAWIAANGIQILNVAGPRESHRPGFVYHASYEFLLRVFTVVQEAQSEIQTEGSEP